MRRNLLAVIGVAWGFSVKRLVAAVGWLILTSASVAAYGRAARPVAASWPLVCEVPPVEAEGHARRVFSVGVMALDPGCHRLARAEGLLRHDAALARTLVGDITGPLEQTRELRWLKGRIALAEGQARVAFEALRPDIDGWPESPHVIWDFAVAAAIVQADSVAREAYQLLIQTELTDERAQVAIRLEFAAVESRRPGEGVQRARAIVSSIALTETDPDSCPWVSAMQAFLDRLEHRPRESAAFPCSRAASWSRYLGSTEGSAAAFAEVPRADSWLRLPRSERVAMLAVGLGQKHRDLRRRLWTNVEAVPDTPLFELKRLELSLRTAGR